MYGRNTEVGDLFKKSVVYVIPPFQRAYAWNDALWQGLVRDVVEAATSEAPVHWLGVILLSVQSGPSHPIADDDDDVLMVIDGQQRLVTLTLWLAALTHAATELGEDPPFSMARTRVEVQASDRKSFSAAVRNEWRDPKHFALWNSGPMSAYVYFRWLLWLGSDALLSDDPIPVPKLPAQGLENEQSIEEFWSAHCASARGRKTLEAARIEAPNKSLTSPSTLSEATRKKLSVFNLIHETGDENAAVIFDSLNGDRMPLESLDHVRNSMFVRIGGDDAERLYHDHWEPIEAKLREIRPKRISVGQLFLYDYLISKGQRKTQGSLNANRAAAHFAKMVQDESADPKKLLRFIKEDLLLAMAAWPVAYGKASEFSHDGIKTKPSRKNLDLVRSIRGLSENPANPIVLHLLCALAKQQISDAQLAESLKLVEGFLVRHLLAGRAFSPLRSRFMEVAGNLYPSATPAAVADALQDQWVSDDEILSEVETSALYSKASPSQLGAIFRGIERHMSGAGAQVFWIGRDETEYTIEHLYPQRPSEEWVQDFRVWKVSKSEMDSLVHTLGNLTVATPKHNSDVGNLSLEKKKQYADELGNAAPLRLNDDWLKADRWDPTIVRKRSTSLVKHALSHWSIES